MKSIFNFVKNVIVSFITLLLFELIVAVTVYLTYAFVNLKFFSFEEHPIKFELIRLLLASSLISIIAGQFLLNLTKKHDKKRKTKVD